MIMQQVIRFTLLTFLATEVANAARAMEDVPQNVPASSEDQPASAEYKRADANYYGKGDVLRSHPSAVIIPQGGYTQKNDSYFFTPRLKAPKEIYAETHVDWIEPITPPDMPASLGVPPDAMQIREPQGDVQVASPSAPANFSPVTDGMTLPNGAVLKTGANGTAAVLFGGVDSARLMPNSAAAVQQTVTAKTRSAEVDLTTGGVFSKVGTQAGVKGEFQVHTPFGNAVAHGGDFVTVISSSRTDVWVAQGVVSLDNPSQNKTVASVASDGMGPLKIMRLPGISDPHLSFQADTESLSEILNFIPMADQKIKGLRDKAAGGATLTANEQAYLARIKKVPCVIKLALVQPPAQATAPAPPVALRLGPSPVVNAPSLTANNGQPKSITARIRNDGKVNMSHATFTTVQLKTKLDAMAKTTPDQAFVIRAGKTVKDEQIQQVLGVFHEAGLQNVKVVAPTITVPAPTASATDTSADNLPTPGLLMHPSMQPITGNTPSTSNSTPESTPGTNSPSASTP
jgi:biopolymer transport protein ExbD